MPGCYSADLRTRVIEAVNEGASRRRASRVFKIGASTAIRWAQRFRETGSVEAKPSGGDRRSHAIEAHKDWLLALVAKEPDLTLEQIRGRLAAEKTFAASVSVLWRFFRRHRISFKKRLLSRCLLISAKWSVWLKAVGDGYGNIQDLAACGHDAD